MKKIMIITALLLVSIGALLAQQKVAPSPEIAAKFRQHFNKATNVQWSRVGSLSVARFKLLQSFRIAYYDHAGNLITNDRKVKEALLPMHLYENMRLARVDWERNSSPVILGGIYEFSKFMDSQILRVKPNR